MKKIHQVDEILKNSWHRVEKIQEKLRTKLLTTEHREKLETELEEIQEALKENRNTLKYLRRENSKSFMIAACLVFICFLFFGIYSMFIGNI